MAIKPPYLEPVKSISTCILGYYTIYNTNTNKKIKIFTKRLLAIIIILPCEKI